MSGNDLQPGSSSSKKSRGQIRCQEQTVRARLQFYVSSLGLFLYREDDGHIWLTESWSLAEQNGQNTNIDSKLKEAVNVCWVSWQRK